MSIITGIKPPPPMVFVFAIIKNILRNHYTLSVFFLTVFMKDSLEQ